jgi:hypothetical protein
MTCDTAQNRLLALPDPDRLPDDLHAHLAGCELCRRYADRMTVLDAELAALPAPASADARAAFLESLAAAGPVIRTVPTAPFRSSVSLWGLAARVRWKPVFATAAAALVAVGVWSAIPGPKPPVAEVDGPRSELVKKVVRYNTELAKASDPRERVAKLAELAADLQAETDRMLGGAEASPLAKVRAYLDADRDALRGCRLGRLAFDPGRDDGVAAPIAAYFTGLQRTLAQLLDQAVTAGELVDSTDTTAVATVIVAGVQGGFVLAALTGDPRAMTDTTRGLQALLPRAVTSHAPRPRSQ